MRAWRDTRIDRAGQDRTSLLAPALASGDSTLDLGWGQIHLDRKVPGTRPEHQHLGCLQIAIPLTPVRWTQSWHDEAGRTRTLTETGLFYFLAPAEMPHATTWHGAADLLNLFIDFDILRSQTDAEAFGASYRPVFTQQNARVIALAGLIQAECRQPGPEHRLQLQGLLLALAAMVVSSDAGGSARPRSHGGLPQATLRRVTDLIERRLSDHLGVDELAAVARLSTRHFQRCFREATGVAPARYIVLRRVDRAKTLLTSTTLSMLEVAAQCGFCDQAHLATALRRVAGVTPLALRKQAPT